MKKQLKTGLCQIEVNENQDAEITAKFEHPMSGCFRVEVFEASSIVFRFDNGGNIIGFTASGITPKENQ